MSIIKKIDYFLWKNEWIDAYVYKVYDGDTIKIIYSKYNKYLSNSPNHQNGSFIYNINPDDYLKVSIRLIGVDTPEIRPKKSKYSKLSVFDKLELVKLEKVASIKIRDDILPMLLGKIIKVRMIKNDKYGGRVLGDIIIQHNYADFEDIPEDISGSTEIMLSDYLIYKKYAKVYNGNEKSPWTKKELEFIINSN